MDSLTDQSTDSCIAECGKALLKRRLEESPAAENQKRLKYQEQIEDEQPKSTAVKDSNDCDVEDKCREKNDDDSATSNCIAVQEEQPKSNTLKDTNDCEEEDKCREKNDYDSENLDCEEQPKSNAAKNTSDCNAEDKCREKKDNDSADLDCEEQPKSNAAKNTSDCNAEDKCREEKDNDSADLDCEEQAKSNAAKDKNDCNAEDKCREEKDNDSADSDYEESSSNEDPFLIHFNLELDGSEKFQYENKKVELPGIGKFVHTKPLLSDKVSRGKEPSLKQKEVMDLNLKKNLKDSLSSQLKKMTKTQTGLLNLISEYFDVIYMKRTHENGDNLRFVYTLHILNHILKSRAKIIHHNSKLSKNPDEEFRDQGFTRTLSVILVPFRHDCFRIVSLLTSFLPECVVMNKKRFDTEYGPPPPPERIKKKPPDYDEIFEGNTNEDFKIGLKIKNKSIALFSEFYSSDLIIASPLGLRQVIGAEGDKKRDFDFLSSVEILVIDRADVQMIQNPVHLLHVLKHFNLLPKESHGCNFFRVRMPILNGMAKYYRQTFLLSSVENMWFEVMFKNQCFNYAGYLTSVTDVRSPAIQNVLIPLKMCFRWFDTSNLDSDMEDRFNFFVNKVLPDYKDKAMSQTMIYIPSYFDFVRLRNHFRESEISAVMICEYSQKGKVAQARDVFFKGHRHFMLYTERAHFYSRYHIKGIQHILFYQPPTYPGFFRELCNLLIDSNPRRQYEEKSCCVIASKHDALQLKHIIGLNELKHMLNSKKKIFVKYTDNK